MQNYFRITRIAIVFNEEDEHKFLLKYFNENQDVLQQGICTFYRVHTKLKSGNAEWRSNYRSTHIDEFYKWDESYVILNFDEFYSFVREDFKITL